MENKIKYFWKNNSSYISTERFNLLLLAPGEIYFEDFSVYYYSSQLNENEAVRKRQKGRLKVCSKSILFEPLDSTYPILKFLYKDVIHAGKWSGSAFSRLDQKGEVIVIESKMCISMKEGSIVAPYKYAREKRKYLFSLNFVGTNGILPQIEQLLRANTLNPHEEASMISTIVEARQARLNFNTSWIEDLYEKIIHEASASKITPLVCNPGRLLVTSKRLYFQPFNNVEPEPVMKINLSNIKYVTKRRYLLRHVGIEIFQKENNTDVYFIFSNQNERNIFYDHILRQEELQLVEDEQENMTLKWQNGALSNFDYLMYLNSKADRSFNDLTQYPVYPWIIKDYTSETLDLDNPDTFRDLSKPIGTLGEERLQQLKERCKGMPEPKFLYGSHYSTPGFVLYYLVRVAPEFMLCLQNGKFDNADRLFNSLLPTWNNCCTGHSDFKELIPEFYNSDGNFLCNSHNLHLGVKQDGNRVNDVHLPPWANGAADFIDKCRQALECDFVSQEIHNWIDLIFGYKQTGEEAWKADNVYYYLTYEGAIDLDSIENENERKCYEAQILEFGQTPKQLFTKPHPKRQDKTAVLPTPTQHVKIDDETYPESIPIAELDSNLDGLAVVEVTGNSLQWVANTILKSSAKLHKGPVDGIAISENEDFILSVSQDTQLKMYSVQKEEQIRSMNLSNMALSCCQLVDDDKHILIGCWDNQIYTYSIEFSRVVDGTHAHYDAVTCLRLKKDTLISSSWDSTVKIWARDASNKKTPLSLLGEIDHDTEVLCCDLFVDDSVKQFVSGTKDATVTLWNADLLMPVFQHTLHTDSVTEVLFSPDGSRILTCSLDEHIRVMDVNTEVEVYCKCLGEGIRCACWDGHIVVAGGESGDVIVWDLMKDKCLTRLQCHHGAVHSLSYNLKKQLLTTGGADGTIAIWQLSSL